MSAAVEPAPIHRAAPSEPHRRPMAPVTRPADDSSAQITPTRATFLHDDDNDSHMAEDMAHKSSAGGATDEDGRKRSYIDRVSSHRSNRSQGSSGKDEAAERADQDDQLDSENDSGAESASGRPSKKKKGQRFYCTDYPPCHLSFTRSEHLARHIRKHTGERPFQCHCLRKFSRLDNLRQHAQTVHVNEEIPGDSLAATGTRFQRQIRTDRMRGSGHRARASTVSNASTATSRGHSRNISGSSISSMPSEVGSPEDRRGAPVLALAPSTPRQRHLTVDTVAMGASPYYQPQYYASPTGYSTPTSVFSGENGSPREPYARLHSPISINSSRTPFGWASHPRRLSVPTAPNPFQPIGSLNSSHSAFINSIPPPQASAFAAQAGTITSPTGSAFSSSDTHGPPADAELKRRTWHPPSYAHHRPATSALTYYQTPDAPQPINATQPAATQAVRLPGIDSFDRMANVRRPPSPMEVDVSSRRGSVADSLIKGESEKRHHRDSWGSMDHHLTKLDLTRMPHSESRPVTSSGPPPSLPAPAQPHSAYAPAHQLSSEPGPEVIEEPATPSKRRRDAWYVPSATANDRAAAHRTSPEGSASSEGLPTPSSTTVADVHPAIRHSNGYVETRPATGHVEEHHKTQAAPAVPYYPSSAPDSGYTYHNQPLHPTPGQTRASQPRANEDTNRLDALVAAATSASESAAAAARAIPPPSR